MNVSNSDIKLMVCMFRKGIIQAQHYPVEAIAKVCGLKRTTGTRALRNQLKRLTKDGYVEQHKPRSFSLSPKGRELARENL